MPESDDTPNYIDIADSDGIPDHLILLDSDSSHSGQIHFPLSDDEMDVVSDEPSAQPNAKSDTKIPMSVANTDSESDSIPDHIVLPCDPDVVPPTAESDTERPMSVANTDSESDSNIILPCDTAESIEDIPVRTPVPSSFSLIYIYLSCTYTYPSPIIPIIGMSILLCDPSCFLLDSYLIRFLFNYEYSYQPPSVVTVLPTEGELYLCYCHFYPYL